MPTGVFLTVLWHKYMYETPETERENTIEDATQKSEKTLNQKRIRTLVHWARMAPVIEGGIEAPMQFLLQVNINLITTYLQASCCHEAVAGNYQPVLKLSKGLFCCIFYVTFQLFQSKCS